jgi:hypothetical protein
LCDLTGLGERTVRITLQRLVKVGALVIVRKHAQNQPTAYRLQTGSFCGSDATSETASDRQSVHARGAESAPEVTTEDTTTTTASSANASTHTLDAVQDCIAIGSAPLTIYAKQQNPRSANTRARNGLTLMRSDLMSVFGKMVQEGAA